MSKRDTWSFPVARQQEVASWPAGEDWGGGTQAAGAVPEAYSKAAALSKCWALTYLFLCPLDFAPAIPLLWHIRVGILAMQLILVLTGDK